MHESFPVKYGLGHRPREVSLLFSLSLSLSAFAVVVLQHLAVHTVFDGEDLEELFGRDGLAYLLVVDGVEACHFCIEAGDLQEAFFVCLLVALGRNILPQTLPMTLSSLFPQTITSERATPSQAGQKLPTVRFSIPTSRP